MNGIDILFILLMLGMLAIGFFQGMVRLAVLLAAFYLSVVLASLYFPLVGGIFQRELGAAPFVAQYIAFGLVLLVAFGLLTTAGLYTFRYVQFTGKLLYLDKFIGLLLGLVLAVFMLSMLAVLLWNLFIERGGGQIDMPLFRGLGSGIANSFLLNYFANFILPESYSMVQPILPSGAEYIFVVAQ